MQYQKAANVHQAVPHQHTSAKSISQPALQLQPLDVKTAIVTAALQPLSSEVRMQRSASNK